MTDFVDCSPELEQRRLDALYRCDPHGRSVKVNEWDGRSPPRFHLMRTARGNLARYRIDLANDLVARLEQLRGQEQTDGQMGNLPYQCNKHLELLSSYAPVVRVWAGPFFVFPQGMMAAAPTVPIGDSNEHLLRGGFDEWLPDVSHRQPFVAVVENNRAVAICASVRISDAVHCAGVETLTGHRSRGNAANAVAGWAVAVRALGAAPFYSTSWENISSQRVADRLHLAKAGADFHVT